MLYRNPVLIILFLFCSLFISAQDKAFMDFTEKELNFGTVRATDGAVNHDFVFVNKGKVPLILNDVKSSCGCTVPEWPKEPILPGNTGKVRINFNPSGQSGAISKSIQIISNAANSPVSLSIKGVVVPAERVEDVYKFSMGTIRLENIYAAFGEINKGKTVRYSIKVANTSNELPATLTFNKVAPHLRITVRPETLPPGQEGIIDIEYNTELINKWDYAVDRLEVLINGKPVQSNRISVTANIKEDFSSLTPEQLAMAPRVEFDHKQFDFGNIKADQMVEHVFILTNAGKSDLHIRKVSASCGCTAVQPSKTVISPGESTEIKAVFNARGREGNQKKAITVISNDPRQSRSILWINAVVENANNPNP